MKTYLLAISSISAVITGLISLLQGFGTIWFWIFAVLAIPFGMCTVGVLMIVIGLLLLSPFLISGGD